MSVQLRNRRRTAPQDLLAVKRSRRRGRLAAGVLAVLVVLGLGIGIGRTTAPAPPPAEPAALPGGPGPSDVADGVPLGYQRSEAGAVAAAANYTVVLGGRANLDPGYGEGAYALFALPDVREDLLRRSREFARTVPDARRLAADPALALRAAPLGYRVETYDQDEAVISIWYAAVGVGTPELPMSTAWGTDRLTLRWVESDWKVADVTGEPGPQPGSSATAGDAALADRINGFRPFTYHPEPTP